MAQITLNTKKTSEAFTINDDDIINVSTLYVDGVASGSKLTIIDTASVIDQTIDVEETPSAIAALTTKLFQVTLTSKETPYLNIGRVKDVITNSDSLADIRYDSNGNVFQTLKTSMTSAQVLAAINTGGNITKEYIALISQADTDAPDEVAVLKNTLGGDITWSRYDAGTYLATLSGAFTQNKTIVFVQGSYGSAVTVSAGWNDANSMFIYTTNTTGTQVDNGLGTASIPASIQILVFP